MKRIEERDCRRCRQALQLAIETTQGWMRNMPRDRIAGTGMSDIHRWEEDISAYRRVLARLSAGQRQDGN
jgi:hypothetical protein